MEAKSGDRMRVITIRPNDFWPNDVVSNSILCLINFSIEKVNYSGPALSVCLAFATDNISTVSRKAKQGTLNRLG
jgi:hypothetical protein